MDSGMHKIVLKATEKQMHEMVVLLNEADFMCYIVRDFDLTQVPEDSFTVLAIEPLSKTMHGFFFEDSKLL